MQQGWRKSSLSCWRQRECFSLIENKFYKNHVTHLARLPEFGLSRHPNEQAWNCQRVTMPPSNALSWQSKALKDFMLSSMQAGTSPVALILGFTAWVLSVLSGATLLRFIPQFPPHNCVSLVFILFFFFWLFPIFFWIFWNHFCLIFFRELVFG